MLSAPYQAHEEEFYRFIDVFGLDPFVAASITNDHIIGFLARFSLFRLYTCHANLLEIC